MFDQGRWINDERTTVTAANSSSRNSSTAAAAPNSHLKDQVCEQQLQSSSQEGIGQSDTSKDRNGQGTSTWNRTKNQTTTSSTSCDTTSMKPNISSMDFHNPSDEMIASASKFGIDLQDSRVVSALEHMQRERERERRNEKDNIQDSRICVEVEDEIQKQEYFNMFHFHWKSTVVTTTTFCRLAIFAIFAFLYQKGLKILRQRVTTGTIDEEVFTLTYT